MWITVIGCGHVIGDDYKLYDRMTVIRGTILMNDLVMLAVKV